MHVYPQRCRNFLATRYPSLELTFTRSALFLDLGVFIGSDLGAATHVRRTVSLCFGTLRQLRHLRRYITDDLLPSLVVSLIHSRLDCGNFILVGYQLTYSDTFSL